MSKWLDDFQLNSVEYLNDVRKAVYLMKSITHPGEYRFGGIGAVQGQANTPIRRLGQCTHVKKAKVKTIWVFVAMLELEKITHAQTIRDLERVVRDYLFYGPGLYKNNRRSKNDYLRRIEKEVELITDFKTALNMVIC